MVVLICRNVLVGRCLIASFFKIIHFAAAKGYAPSPSWEFVNKAVFTVDTFSNTITIRDRVIKLNLQLNERVEVFKDKMWVDTEPLNLCYQDTKYPLLRLLKLIKALFLKK